MNLLYEKVVDNAKLKIKIKFSTIALTLNQRWKFVAMQTSSRAANERYRSKKSGNNYIINFNLKIKVARQCYGYKLAT
ncbi:hypothetical protein SAMN05421858_4678 [Haladaptatus litoreus]|uniref:Uncharacterized protein n=1 Tax=Haladaptatus litoreus TaxID=553468 RepID=A0A1N7F0F1_9EURY|nr:hypothetical protein SAMN05421858_4678 [Haladaptatus litoreus]